MFDISLESQYYGNIALVWPLAVVLSQAINRRLEELRAMPNFKEVLSGIQEEALNLDSRLCLITNYSVALSRLSKTPIWISYGGIRTASTFAFNALKLLAGSISDRVICAWEKDLAAPSSILNIVSSSGRNSLGVLKIHRYEDGIPALLARRKAKAIVTVRDYPGIAKSWWRMTNNSQAKTFYNTSLQPQDAVRVIRRELRNEIQKRQLPNVLFLREDIIRNETRLATRQIARFLGLRLAPGYWSCLKQNLSLVAMQKKSGELRLRKSPHAHDTFLHPGHVRHSSDKIPGEDFVEDLIWQNFSSELSPDGYLKI